MLYNKNKSYVMSCQKHCFKTHCFPKKQNTLFSNMCTFLSHCFEMKNYHCLTELQNANKFSYILFPNHLF